MPHICQFCKRNIDCESEKNNFSICDCESVNIIEHKQKNRYYFCDYKIFPSCHDNWLMAKYNVSYLKLIETHRNK